MTTSKEINGYDRVTDVIYPFSGLTNVDPEILKWAAHRGSIVHQICDCIIRDIPIDEYDSSYEGYINSFKIWKNGKTFLPKTPRWFCDELMITGECDGIYEKEGKLILFDLKTPVRIGSTWGMQGAAYAYLARKHGHTIDQVEFIRLKKDGSSASVHPYPLVMDDFLICLQVYRKYFKKTVTENFDY